MDRTLLVVRHAKSDQGVGVPDHERPLNGRGRRDAPALGRWLARHHPRIDRVLCSSAVRTRETWALASAELAEPPAVEVTDALYETSPRAVLGLLHAVDDGVRTLVVVGHEPTQSGLVGLLAGSADPRAEATLRDGFTTSAVAVLEVDGWAELAPGSARLAHLEVPRG